MKGLIALLLTMMMTGMVFSQQSQSRFSSGEAGATGESKRFLLVMTDELIRGLKREGQLAAGISREERALIANVVFHGSDVNSERIDLQPFPVNRAPAADDSGRLEFILNDSQIEMMRRQGLKYIIRDADRGKYTKVVVTYEGAQTRSTASASRSVSSTTSADSGGFRPSDEINRGDGGVARRNTTGPRDNGFTRRNDLDFGGRSSRFDNNDRTTDLVRDRNFIGPLLPDEVDARERWERNSSRNNNFLDSDRRVTEVVPRRTSEFDRDVTQGIDRNRGDFASVRTRRNTGLDLSRNYEDAVSRDDRLVNTRNDRTRGGSDLVLNDDRQTRDYETAAEYRQRLLDERRILEREESADYEKRRLALQNEQLKKMLDDERLIRDKTELELERERRLASDDSFLRDRRRIDDLEDRYEYRGERRFIDDYSTGGYANRRGSDLNERVVVEGPRLDDRYTGTGMPGRRIEPEPSDGLPTLAIGGPTDRSDSRTGPGSPIDKALYFIVLCSVGLNIYLGMIARSFYVRYEELADEIRDTFTSSSAI